MPYSIRKFHLLLAAVLSLATHADAAENIHSIYTINGYYLGLVDSGKLLCYELEHGMWKQCRNWTPIPIPDDIAFISNNSRNTALAQKGNVGYYDMEGRLQRSCSHALPGSLNEHSQVFLNSDSTECEVFMRDGDYLYIYTPARASKETATKIKFTCKDIAPSSDVFWYDVQWRIATVEDNFVKIYRIYRVDGSGKSNDLSCLPEPEKTLHFDAPQDEIVVIDGGIFGAEDSAVAARKGNTISFYEYSPESKSWRKVRYQEAPGQEAPSFSLNALTPDGDTDTSAVKHDNRHYPRTRR